MGAALDLRPLTYAAFNTFAAVGITFANKAVFSVFHFNYVYMLTLIHALATVAGMHAFAAAGMFEPKALKPWQVLPLAVAFVGYVVLWNVSLQLNSVGFYQLMKIMTLPAVVLLEYVMLHRRQAPLQLAAVATVCVGVGLATVADSQVTTNLLGMGVSVAAVLFTGIYQVWVGSKQKELGAGSMQLMHAYAPYAVALLALLVVACEPLGLHTGAPGTVADYLRSQVTPAAAVAIAGSAALGLLVSLSMFLMIGATSGVTFNVVGHVKTVLILAGGVALFGDSMPPTKAAGVVLAIAGIAWHSFLSIRLKAASAEAAAASVAKPDADLEAKPLLASASSASLRPSSASSPARGPSSASGGGKL
ncbi:hypothetical protein WJX81_005426 [Elliptochloris bilobata]|uniref:Sugar phosphate transporter domain-containing protein n=1 Tax=Elliptochloris bilobata TaxID=381761 RepID=A0AAW1R400_9CHLO